MWQWRRWDGPDLTGEGGSRPMNRNDTQFDGKWLITFHLGGKTVAPLTFAGIN
jgi:hypothetical protein